ncbi:MAG: J domain-containing protein [Lachnospiraceae bacterium]|nr:J domain-containing protein [Lachnospiraceae bacterium]
MSDIWSMLGIEPTDDKKAIRRAFAAQSRLHHPEEEPEYFAALNQAYKVALDSGAGGEKAWEESVQNERPEKENVPHETVQEKSEDTGGESSLLKRLDQAAQQAIKKSMETGALHDFIVLFENPKQAKQADTWKRFFLTEGFLEEQFTEEFGKGLLTYLAEQTLCPSDNLPKGLLQELAIAYAFIPHFAGEEYFEGLKYPKEWYKVSVENTFPGRRYAAEIFNMQGRECDLKSMTNHILRQPANKVRHNAFSDYLAVKEMSRDGRLTDGEREVWQHILGACQPCYLFERNGKKSGGADYESRSESVVKLYVQWLKEEQLPEAVLLFFYKKLDFKTLERSSTRGLYSALKEEVLRQLPGAEEILFGEDGKEQLITRLYRTYSAIINDNQNNYDKFIYGETPEIRDRAKAFFASPEWEQLKKEKGLFERIYSASKRIVMPRTVAETLVGHLSQGDFPEPARTELTESLLRSLATEKMCRELDYRWEITLSSTNPEDIGDNPDFWQYFLMRGFGFRHEKIRGTWEEDFIYVMNGQCYLPAYINYIYAPSRAWQRQFVGFDQEREEIGEPVSLVCSMPGARRLRVEFHYHYCLYFVEGLANDTGRESANQVGKEVQVAEPVLAFSELREYAGKLEKPEEFFFLLAVTAIEDADRSAARTLIEAWLKRIPVHPFIIPLVARLLAADNDRIPAAVQPGGRTAVLYSEQERVCFRAVVSEEGVSIWRQLDYGWQDIIFRSAELGWRKWEEYACKSKVTGDSASSESRRAAARNVLDTLRQPAPRLRVSYSLEGMDTVQKAAKILEVMGCIENMEGYCVLRYGAKKEKRHDRVFYGARAPFGFELMAHSAVYVRSRDFLMASSNTKIKEPKILVGRFGWGFKYSPSSDYGPMYVYQGESGRFYAYGAIRMHRADTLDQLLADFFQKEWEGVTEVQGYEGSLTVSRLDHRLEYCYTEEDMRQSMETAEDTVADRFTLFGGYQMWLEFVRWLDEALNPQLPPWVNAIVTGLDWERGGALTFAGIHENEEDAELQEFQEKADLDFEDTAEEEEADGDASDEEASDQEEADGDTSDMTGAAESDRNPQNEVYLPQLPLLIWAKGMDRRDRADFLINAMQWYVDCGRFAEKTGDRKIRILVN